MANFIQLLIFGLQLGSVYALIAIGYTMVYGIIGLINFAHGDFLMIGAFVAYFAVQLFDFGFVPSLIAAMVFTGALGMFIERVAYNPLRNKPRVSALITAIGVSIILENLPRALPFIGPAPRPFPELLPKIPINFGGVTSDSTKIIIIVLAIILMAIMQFFVTQTKPGRNMRAVSFDKDASALMGINVNRTIAITFFIGAALAAAGGIFYASAYPSIDVYMGIILGQKAFIAAVLGGIGNIPGAMAGGFILGIAEIYATSINSDIGYGMGFAILILILLFKPAGLMGKLTVEKV